MDLPKGLSGTQERRLSVSIRSIGLLGRAVVFGLLLIYGLGLIRDALAVFSRPLNTYTLEEMARFFGGAVLLTAVVPGLFRWPEDDETLRLWAWGCVMACSGTIFALTVLRH